MIIEKCLLNVSLLGYVIEYILDLYLIRGRGSNSVRHHGISHKGKLGCVEISTVFIFP